MGLFKKKATLKVGFQSDIDRLFQKLNTEKKCEDYTANRKAEIKKHTQLFKKRDTSTESDPSDLWEDF